MTKKKDSVFGTEGIQDTLFQMDSGESENVEIGYRGHSVVTIVGISYRQLDYWDRTDLVSPSIQTANGSGTRRLYSFRDVLVLKIIKQLLDAGISLTNIRRAMENLKEIGTEDLSTITLVSDGNTVYDCRSKDEVFDLLAGGQGVFGIGIPTLAQELEGEIRELPGERVIHTKKGKTVSAGATVTKLFAGDELAARRAQKEASNN